MWDIPFAIALITLNISFFLWLSVSRSIKLSRKRSLLFASLALFAALIFLYLNSEKYMVVFYMSLALMALMAMRFAIDKILSRPLGNDNSTRNYFNFFDSFIFPLFVLFISIAQCVFLFLFSN